MHDCIAIIIIKLLLRLYSIFSSIHVLVHNRGGYSSLRGPGVSSWHGPPPLTRPHPLWATRPISRPPHGSHTHTTITALQLHPPHNLHSPWDFSVFIPTWKFTERLGPYLYHSRRQKWKDSFTIDRARITARRISDFCLSVCKGRCYFADVFQRGRVSYCDSCSFWSSPEWSGIHRGNGLGLLPKVLTHTCLYHIIYDAWCYKTW